MAGPMVHIIIYPIQKAISYSMTSPFTTGGIRGNKKGIGQFHPRSFNMGISRQVWEKAGGFIITRLGEDIEYSIRIHSLGFKIGLIPDAIVYHKRRTNFLQFYKQFIFLAGRVSTFINFSQQLKSWFIFSRHFTVGIIFTIIANISQWPIACCATFYISSLHIVNIFSLLVKNKSAKIAFLSIIAALTQLTAYGLGFMQDFWKRVVLKDHKNVVCTTHFLLQKPLKLHGLFLKRIL
jgi:cellulose synthase/poly-beta-1,6-N-acetylglucosamine synthase-like glycosyltransferase